MFPYEYEETVNFEKHRYFLKFFDRSENQHV